MVKNRKDLTPRRSFRVAANRNRTVPTANVKVVVRVRPHNAKELGDNCKTVVKVVDDYMLMFDPEEDVTPFFYHGVQQKGRDLLKKAHKNMKFSFDRVFGFESNNEEVFQYSTKSLIETLMDGCNCSVFVYGATGAGKTHTMLGHNEAPGITYLTMQELFKQKEELSGERDFELAVSYLEVYNENVQDLLKPGCAPLHLREDSKLGVMVAGITLKRITNPNELFDLLAKGNKNRTQHPTDANAESSRSHAVFQVYIRMNVKSTGQTRLAKLSMIDLAGSERGAATGCKGVRFTEGANINKSLLALGNCINSLADGQRHVPYRDSKLTRLLKDSLGGNCHTIMIANISPSSLSFEDTYNTLKYATRAKKIKSNIKKNVVNTEMNASQYLKIIEELNMEIAKLKGCPTTVSECEKCKTTKVEEKPNNSEGLQKLKAAYEDFKSTQERLSKLNVNKKVLETRVNIKEEANNRLSDFCVDTPEKEKAHKKLEHTMDRLKKQAHAFSTDVEVLQQKISLIQENIAGLLTTYPDLQTYNELEFFKIQQLRTNFEMESIQNMNKIQEKELEVRGVLLEQMAKLLQPWFLILRGQGLTTETMAIEYQSVCNQLQGACTVSFDDGDTIPTIVVPPRINEDETRATKRKLPADLETTFTMSPIPSVNKGSSDRLLTKVCPSPAKRPAKLLPHTTRTVLTENRIKIKTAVGTMGTASRFPSCSRNPSIKLLTKQALPQKYKRTK